VASEQKTKPAPTAGNPIHLAFLDTSARGNGRRNDLVRLSQQIVAAKPDGRVDTGARTHGTLQDSSPGGITDLRVRREFNELDPNCRLLEIHRSYPAG